MAGRFPLYTDADVQGPVIRALKAAEWESPGDFLNAFEALTEQDNPFSPYPILYLIVKRL